jgi:CheY-like chemotaxis protein
MARILIADDVLLMRTLLNHVLRRGGHDVLEADAGDEALDILRHELPDIAILDVRMPGLSGFDVCQAVRADPCLATIGLIVLSGDMTELHGRADRADYVLAKPFSPAVLLNVITKLLRAPGRVGTPVALRQEPTRASVVQTVPARLHVAPTLDAIPSAYDVWPRHRGKVKRSS